MKQPSASIVIPIYNVGEFLDRCIESAVNQTYKNIRIILVDDGSADGSPEICDLWAKKDKRITVIHKENSGVGQARNDGINEATGDYIFFLDGDDFFDEKTVEKCISEAVKNSSDIVMFGHSNVTPDGKCELKEVKTDKNFFEKTEAINQLLPGLFTYKIGLGISICMKMFDLKIIKEKNIRFGIEREFVSEDACFLLEYFTHISSASVLEENLYFYRKNEKSFSRRFKENAQKLNDGFLQRATSISEKNNYPEAVLSHIKARYLMYTISALKQIVRSDAEQKSKFIKEIFNDKLLSEATQKSTLNLLSKSSKIFWSFYRKKLYFICLILLKLKENNSEVFRTKEKIMRTKEFGKLYIKKRTVPEWLTLFIFVMPFLLSFFLDFLQLPGFLKHTIDLAWIGVFAFMFIRKQAYIDKKIVGITIAIVAFFVYTIAVYIFNFQSPLFYLWGLRNNFRFYIAFIAFAVFLTNDDIETCFRFLDIMFWINAAVVVIQFFVLGYEQDYLGGIFGVDRGCNAYSIIFFSIVVGKSILCFMDGKENVVNCILKSGASLIIAAMAEIKFYFLIFVLILAMSMFFTKLSWRKFAILIVMAVLILFAGSALTIIFDESDRLTFEHIVELMTATNYSSAEDLGRFTAVPTISKTIFTDWWGRLFGMGLGNCDTSSFAIFNTPFYQTYEYLHYNWFSSAFLFLETGYVGLTAYFSFFVFCFFNSLRLMRKNMSDRLHCQIAMIIAIICIALTVYNSSLRTEAGYMAFFALALPLISKKSAENT